MDRGYLDFSTLCAIHQAQAFFVTRAKCNTQFRQSYSDPVDRSSTSVICDQIRVLKVFHSSKDNSVPLSRDLDCRVNLRANRHCQEASAACSFTALTKS
jgi:hypothetical protein